MGTTKRQRRSRAPRAATARAVEPGATQAPPSLPSTGPPATAGESPRQPAPLPPNPGPTSECQAEEVDAEPIDADGAGLPPEGEPLTPESLLAVCEFGRFVTVGALVASLKVDLPAGTEGVYSLSAKERASLERLAPGAVRWIGQYVPRLDWIPAAVFGITYLVGTMQVAKALRGLAEEQREARKKKAADQQRPSQPGESQRVP